MAAKGREAYYKEPGSARSFDMDRKQIIVGAALVLAGCLFVHPAFADAGSLPWETPLQIILDALTGTTGTLLACVAVAAVGVMALAGRISWAMAGSVLFGIACLFGCVRIVAIFHG
jgi:type IV secretion system protein VirB2